MTKDLSSFTKRIPVAATARDIYQAWTIPNEIEKWFLSDAKFYDRGTLRGKDERAETGDIYEWSWYGFADGATERGRVLAANGHDGFSFTFADGCIVDVTVLREADEKIVQVVQRQIPVQPDMSIYLNCSEGWTFYLANLKSVLEGGVDLRNRNVSIRNIINS